jgi:integrase
MLTTKRIAKLLKQPGRYLDAHGLVLQVINPNNASWLLRYQTNGVEHWHGLGPLHVVGLADARLRAKAARLQLLDGVDPIAAKKNRKEAAKRAAANSITFREASETYHRTHAREWRSVKHAMQWLKSLQDHAFPALGGLNVRDITKVDVLRAIEKIWAEKTVTASRVLNRIATVLSWATMQGYRDEGAANPAKWEDQLEHALPAPAKIAKPQNFAALDYRLLPEFMAELRRRDGVAARAMQFTILCAVRSGETYGAVWPEIDLQNKLWVIPAKRMKSGREHKIPLPAAAIALLKALPRERDNEFVFIGPRAKGLSTAAFGRLLSRMDRSAITTHGMRSAFSTWAHEQTKHADHTIEISLAHSVGNETAKAYQRGDLLLKRRQLMDAWSRYCTTPPKVRGKPKAEEQSNVVLLREARR